MNIKLDELVGGKMKYNFKLILEKEIIAKDKKDAICKAKKILDNLSFYNYKVFEKSKCDCWTHIVRKLK